MPLVIRRTFSGERRRLPPLFKTRNFKRPFARISDNGMEGEQLIETNFGLAPHLRCHVRFTRQNTFWSTAKQCIRMRNNRFVNELASDRVFLDVGVHEEIFTFSVFHAVGKDVILHNLSRIACSPRRCAKNLRKNSIEAHANRVALIDHNGSSTFFET